MPRRWRRWRAGDFVVVVIRALVVARVRVMAVAADVAHGGPLRVQPLLAARGHPGHPGGRRSAAAVEGAWRFGPRWSGCCASMAVAFIWKCLSSGSRWKDGALSLRKMLTLLAGRTTSKLVWARGASLRSALCAPGCLRRLCRCLEWKRRRWRSTLPRPALRSGACFGFHGAHGGRCDADCILAAYVSNGHRKQRIGDAVGGSCMLAGA